MIYKETFQDGITQSEMTVMDECMFKWNMRYNRRLELEGYYRIPLMFGTAWHQFQEVFHGGGKVENGIPILSFPENAVVVEGDEDKLKQYQWMLDGMCKGYAKFYKDDLKTFKWKFIEKEFEVEFMGLKFKFKIDRLSTKGELFDAKTTSMLRNDILAKWDFKFQFIFYAWGVFKADCPVNEFIVDVVKKPQIRPTKGEPLIAYGRRVEMDLLGKPDQYFYRNKVDVSKEVMANFQENILMPKIERWKLMNEAPGSLMWNNKNTEACHHYGETCQYFPICSGTGSPKDYIKLPVKHTEYNESK